MMRRSSSLVPKGNQRKPEYIPPKPKPKPVGRESGNINLKLLEMVADT